MDVIEFPCPNCGKPIELPAEDAGSTRPCPRCEEWVTVPSRDEAVIDEPPPKPVPAREVSPPRPPPADTPSPAPAPPEQPVAPPARSSALGGGWSCLVTGLLLMYFLPRAHLVYLPLFAVAFILGIVALAQGKTVGGQLVLILSLLAPVILGVHFLGMELPEWARIPGLTDTSDATGPDAATAETEPVNATETSPAPPPWPPPARGDRRPTPEWVTGDNGTRDPAPTTDWGASSTATETDWKERYAYWVEQYRSRFKAPPPGAKVRLELTHGAAAEGTLRMVGREEVTLQIPNGFVTYDRERLAEPTRRQYFREDYARYYAQRRVQTERDGETAPQTPSPQRNPPPASQPGKPTRGFGDFL